MAKPPFIAAAVFNPRPPCGSRSAVHLHALFDFFMVSINISAAASSNAMRTFATARFIVEPPFLNVGAFLLIRSSLNRNPQTLKYREEGKMQAGAHQRSTLGNLAAGAGQTMRHSSHRKGHRNVSGSDSIRGRSFRVFLWSGCVEMLFSP